MTNVRNHPDRSKSGNAWNASWPLYEWAWRQVGIVANTLDDADEQTAAEYLYGCVAEVVVGKVNPLRQRLRQEPLAEPQRAQREWI